MSLLAHYPEWFAWSSSMVVFGSCVITFYVQSRPTVPLDERVHYPDLFISDSIDFPPGQEIGSFFLSIGAVLLAYTILIRYIEVMRTMRQTKVECSEADTQRQQFSAITGTLCVIGALGVCAVPVHASMWGHTIFATLFFVCGSWWSYLQNWIDRECGMAQKVPAWVEPMRKYTSWGAIGMVAAGLSFWGVCSAVVGMGDFKNHNKLVATAAVMEIVTFGLMLANLWTYGISLQGLRLSVVLKQAEGQEALMPAGEGSKLLGAMHEN